jgi:histidyl-tRNA synthetase
MSRVAIPGDEILKRARAVGQYYGFAPLAELAAEARKEPRERETTRTALPEIPAPDPVASTVASFLNQCRNAGLAGNGAHGPMFVWHTNLASGRPAPKRVVIQFHAVGTERALADAVVIRALIALVRDLAHAEPFVRLNSMGDRETRARYLRELAVFFKRRANALPPECVAAAKEDAFAAADLAIARECAESLPAPTEYLSDASRKRFEELLEHLEATDTPYELARDLMSRGTHWNDACFEILVGGQRFAWGSRYNELARHVLGTPIPAIGAVLQIESTGAPAPLPHAPASRARFVFVHIGDEAKRLSIQLADDFRKAHLPLAQDIGIESLTEQMRLAEKRNPTYLIIMGRKEALDGTVILRNRETQDEMTLPLPGLAERLKAVA